ncbi:MAG: DNA repair protein RadA [Burkholderiaceae bacterium]
MSATKVKSQFVCGECGGISAKWQGKCLHCGAWNQLEEVTVAAGSNKSRRPLSGGERNASVIQMDQVPAETVDRFATGSDEFDRVLGGGLVAGSVVLIGGDPGIGKSTLLLQALIRLETERPVLYVTGEESAAQVALRARRLGLEKASTPLLCETELELILGAVGKLKPAVVVIDSIQTIYSSTLDSAPGSVSQVRECAARLTRLAKETDVAIVMIGHVTKEGTLAGPRVLEHIVDTVLYFEGDSQSAYRLVRAFKNRFGAVNELGVFAMTDRGLRGVANPSAIFLSQQDRQVAGSCVLVTQEGTRPLLVEIQALVDAANLPNPRRLTVGLDASRLAMLLAVLNRHAGITCGDQDVFVNAVGGVRVTEPAADLAIVLSIVSSLKNRPLTRGLAVFGELGLAGEVRPAPRGQERLREAAKLGFGYALVPKANAPKREIEGLQVMAVEHIDEALELAWSV